MSLCFNVLAGTPPYSTLTVDATGTLQNNNTTITCTNAFVFTGPLSGGTWSGTTFNSTTFSNNIFVSSTTTNYTLSDGVNVYYYIGTVNGYYTNQIFNISSGTFIYKGNIIGGVWSNTPAYTGWGTNVSMLWQSNNAAKSVAPLWYRTYYDVNTNAHTSTTGF